MPRVFLHLAAGTGRYRDWPAKTIRLVRYGCTNRPFYHIVVIEVSFFIKNISGVSMINRGRD